MSNLYFSEAATPSHFREQIYALFCSQSCNLLVTFCLTFFWAIRPNTTLQHAIFPFSFIGAFHFHVFQTLFNGVKHKGIYPLSILISQKDVFCSILEILLHTRRMDKRTGSEWNSVGLQNMLMKWSLRTISHD